MSSYRDRNIQYYKGLGFENFKSWSEKDLSQFLIFDYFDTSREIVGTEDINEKSFSKAQSNRIEKYNKYRIPLKVLDGIFLKLCVISCVNKQVSEKTKKHILFEGSRFASLILQARKSFSVQLTVEGQEDRLFSWKHLIGYLNMNELDELVFSYMKERDIKYLHLMVERIEDKLRIAAPDLIVLCMDMFPIERAMVLVAKNLRIPTLVVQHGMMDESDCRLDFKVSDYVLVWGEYFKNLCANQCMRILKDIYILGYPFVIGESKGVDNKRRRVCYLGQDVERYNKDFLQIKIETIKQISKICKKLGMDFIYRPHPRREKKEIIAEYLSGIELTPKTETLEDTFKKADIFISFSSTSLLEASIREKITLQLINFPYKIVNLEELGACSKSFLKITEIQEYLAKISAAPDLKEFQSKPNNQYIETQYESWQRFLEIIKEIGLM